MFPNPTLLPTYTLLATPTPPETCRALLEFEYDEVVFDTVKVFAIEPPEKPPVEAMVSVLDVPTDESVIPDPATKVNGDIEVFAIKSG